MKYARIDLEKTNYQLDLSASMPTYPNPKILQEIYRQYCVYKNFDSVMPLFDTQFLDPNIDVICYGQEEIVAFSLVRKHDLLNVEGLQFAWNYSDPKQRWGINSLKHECAYYKAQGYRYYYLGGAEEYKSQLDGFEILGGV